MHLRKRRILVDIKTCIRKYVLKVYNRFLSLTLGFSYRSLITRSWNIWFHKVLAIFYYQGDCWLVKKVFVPWYW